VEAQAAKEGRSASNLVSIWLEDKLSGKHKPKAPDWAEEAKAAFWAAYPRKTSKKPAMSLLDKMIAKKPDIEFWRRVIDDAGRRFATTQKQYIPHPTTYLNQERWEDEVIDENSNRNPQSRIDRIMQQAGEVEGLFRRGCAEGERDVGPDDAIVQEQMGLPGRRN
jgi:hypothetical protein